MADPITPELKDELEQLIIEMRAMVEQQARQGTVTCVAEYTERLTVIAQALDALGSRHGAGTRLEQLEKMAEAWIAEAERTRLNRGQRTREQSGHEVLANCAYALRDAVAALRDPAPAPGWQPHYWTPDPTNRFCVICGDNGLGSVWGVHRFQIQPGDPDFKCNCQIDAHDYNCPLHKEK